jgi:signal transduction histidine kinase
MVQGLTAAPDPSFDRFANLVRLAIDVPVALVSVVESDRQVLPGSVGLPEPWQSRRETPLSHSFCQYVVADNAPLIVSDARQDARLKDNLAIEELDVVAYAGFPMVDPLGAPVGSVCAIDSQPRIWTDTELRVLKELAEICSNELALQDSRRALAESYSQLSAFAGQVSHDLKTPLTTLIGFLGMVRLEVEVSAESGSPAVSYVDRSIASGGRMLLTINELLEFSSLGGELTLISVSLDALMADVLTDLDDVIDGAAIEWSGPSLTADRTQLRILIQNLVANSLKYRRPDRPCRIAVTTRASAKGCQLQVSDNGPGIPPEERSKVLRPLVRLRHDVPGSGLGLATCQRIASAHHAVLRVGAGRAGGTTISIQFPQ